ncbi:MAG TPA: hypothetical protein VF503_09135 [Sphingobium sp.]|uniref:hypothetical protein n=1 Tax=Sphingobium sp. TaxID=1912891 RepID=UPI002ED4923E
MQIVVRGNIAPVHRGLDDLVRRQVPFATAHALTNLAQGVQDLEKLEMTKTFDTPTDFTMNAIAIRPATPRKLRATVYPREIASHYLEPYVVGGNRSLWSKKGDKKGMIVPRAARTNAHGNLPAGTLKRLKSQPDVFIGRIRFKKSGKEVSGVWQRPPVGTRRDGSRGTKASSHNVIGGSRTGLKLLIQFEDSTPVPRTLPFYEAAEAYLNSEAVRQFKASLALALKTARR